MSVSQFLFVLGLLTVLSSCASRTEAPPRPDAREVAATNSKGEYSGAGLSAQNRFMKRFLNTPSGRRY